MSDANLYEFYDRELDTIVLTPINQILTNKKTHDSIYQ